MENEMKTIEEKNAALLTKGDDSIVVCEEHGVRKRWGDMSPVAQLAVLSGLDTDDKCLMEY